MRILMYGHFFAEPWKPGQTHKFLYTETQLKGTLNACGFVDIARIQTYRYKGDEDINLGMEAFK
jgi:citrate lyase synthetase